MIQLLWLTLLATHTAAAAVWWWVVPGGFPSSSALFWTNQFFPPILMVLLLVALVARGRLSEAILPPVLAALCVFWMAFAISARIVFFETFRSMWNLPFLGGAILGGLWIRRFGLRRKPIWVIPLVAVFAGLAGYNLPGTQRAPDATTRPAGASFTAPASGSPDQKLMKVSKDAQLRPGDGRLVVRRDKLVVNVQPMLSFADRSPDRAWTSGAPESMSFATARTLTSKAHDGAHFTLGYKDEDASLLDVTARDGAIQIDSLSRLPQPVFSHANSFAEVTVQGHKKLTVSFSPAPQKRIEVPPATEAARFAYLDEAGTFHVAQASAGRRGPFTELASGKMASKDPLVLTLYDADKPVFTISFDDWAAQLSTQLSPTAGSGVTVNAIELERGGERDDAPVLISLSLAATAIGRGTMTVGYAAGVYRDRITVALPP
jgi:hypothetical protein